jgi:wyosine [tRNA(Phe)-imidazoG37] synthetase (radical SAM superfamily)
MKLQVTNHDRDVVGMRYVYPVVSRRARGVSVGINLNPNNACNYRCIYCQVPDLTFGKGPVIQLPLLERELRALLTEIVRGDFLERHAPEDSQRLNDIALSGNGEPTSSPQFVEVLDVVAAALSEFELRGKIKVVLITNGTLTDRPRVEEGLQKLAALGGEVWFKLDSATLEGTVAINSNSSEMVARVARLRRVAELCPTYIQTCVFALDGAPPSATEQEAYLALLAELWRDAVPLCGVLLYGLARPSMQLEAPRLSPLPERWLEEFAAKIAALGVPVSVTP